MARLFMKLPSFATDYSGAASFLSDIGGLVAVHGPTGCIGNYTGYDDPRWFSSPGMVFNSALREIDAVMGNDHALIENMRKACEIYNPCFTAIVGTPIPDLIGCDITGAADDLEKVIGIPSVGVPTNGYGYYHNGIEKSMFALEKKFSVLSCPNRGKINILGHSHYDYGDGSAMEILADAIADSHRSIGFGSPADGLAAFTDIGCADANIAVSSSGMKFAEYLENSLNMPFIASAPIGAANTELIKDFIKGNRYEETRESGNILIIGDHVVSDSLRREIFRETGLGSDVATFFGLHDKTAGKRDIVLRDENDLINISKRYEIIVGDPLYSSLAPGNLPFVPFAHPAVSGKMFREHGIGMIGLMERVKEAIRRSGVS
ncbi:MAG: nitrogenase component 1 [Candidatus Methanoplasma sp.]|jgi:hypothetical protein|nr:nitrogenase component 1 [Candidatus Methanoplasma sp.]